MDGRRRTPGRPLRLLVASGGVGFWVLWPLAVAAQPAFDPVQDLTSSLASVGARLPALGISAIASLALGYGAAAVLLLRARVRVAAAAALGAAATTLGVATVRITCPRGARGCSGQASGRSSPLPAADRLHVDLVVAFEVCFVVLAVATGVALLRRGLRGWGVASLVASVVSPALLLGVQLGSADGAWQLPWIATGSLWLLGAAATVPPGKDPL